MRHTQDCGGEGCSWLRTQVDGLDLTRGGDLSPVPHTILIKIPEAGTVVITETHSGLTTCPDPSIQEMTGTGYDRGESCPYPKCPCLWNRQWYFQCFHSSVPRGPSSVPVILCLLYMHSHQKRVTLQDKLDCSSGISQNSPIDWDPSNKFYPSVLK